MVSAWGQALEKVKRQLMGLPARLAGQAVGLGVLPEKELLFRAMVQVEIDRICGILAGDQAEAA